MKSNLTQSFIMKVNPKLIEKLDQVLPYMQERYVGIDNRTDLVRYLLDSACDQLLITMQDQSQARNSSAIAGWRCFQCHSPKIMPRIGDYTECAECHTVVTDQDLFSTQMRAKRDGDE